MLSGVHVSDLHYNFFYYVSIGFVNFKSNTLNIILSNLKIIYFNGLKRENPSSYKTLTVLYSLKYIDVYINKIKWILFHINEMY